MGKGDSKWVFLDIQCDIIEYNNNNNNNNNAHNSIGPFSWVDTAGQLTGQFNLFTVPLHQTIMKGSSLND